MAVVKAKGKKAKRKLKRNAQRAPRRRPATKKKARAVTTKPREVKRRSTAPRPTPNAKRDERTQRAIQAPRQRRRSTSAPTVDQWSFPSPPPPTPPISAASAAIREGRCPCGGANESCDRCFGTGRLGVSQFDLTGPTRPKPEPEPIAPGLFDAELRAAAITRASSPTSRSGRSGTVLRILSTEEPASLHVMDRYVDALVDLCQHEPSIRGLVIDCPICYVACTGTKYAEHARTRHNALIAQPAYGRFSPEAYESVFKEFVQYRDQSESHAKRHPSKLPCSRCYRSVTNVIMHMRIYHQEDWSTRSSPEPSPSESPATAPVRRTPRALSQGREPSGGVKGWPTLGDQLRASGIVK